MKRFLADAFLILMLVSIGSYINQKEKTDMNTVVNKKVEQFEEEVARHKVVKPQSNPVILGNVEDNSATRLANNGSEFVVGAIHGTVGIFSQLFDSLIK